MYLRLKSRKKQQEFLEKCFIFAFENREISSNSEVDLAFFGVKPSLTLKNSGGGKNNISGKNQYNSLKNNEVFGQSEVSQRSVLGHPFINNKDINNKIKEKENINKEKEKTSFEQWWKLYPRKISKGEAQKKYEKIIKDNLATSVELLEGLNKYNNYIKTTLLDVKFVKHPSTWLNQKCWLDEYSSGFVRPSDRKPMTAEDFQNIEADTPAADLSFLNEFPF